MERRWRVSSLLAATVISVAAIGLVSADPALADTTVGRAAGNYLCFGGFVAADPSYQIPAGGGVITSFSYLDDANNAGQQLDFEVLQPNADGSYTIVGHTGIQTLAGSDGVETFPADIPVSGGEVLGYYETGTDNCLEKGTFDNVPAQYWGSDPSIGTTLSQMSGSPIAGASLNESANLAPPSAAVPAPLSAAGNALSSTEGQQFGGAVATFSDADGQPASAYPATIDWGDGSSSTGVVTQTSAGQYEVDGSHTYAEEGTYPVSVQVSDQDGTGAQASGTAAVGDAGLSATGMGEPASPVLTTSSFAAPVASLSDANSSGSAGDFTATIDWGDGTSSEGTVTGSGGSYSVSGSHSYGADGPYTVAVHIADDGGSVVDAITHVLVYEYADQNGGSFVIGDGVAGSRVYFWGADWAAQNPLSGGDPPRAFKGFASSSAQSCGATFTARPGRSAAPPAAVASFVAVAVTGSVSKSGPEISGTVQKIVVVRTDAGYGPDLGSPRTGEVVATVCG